MAPNKTPKAEKKISESSGHSDLAQNVTAENYLAKSKAFLAVNGDGFLIGLRNGICQGVHFSSTPKQWGAWRAYFIARKIGVRFMDRRGKTGECYTVPAEWPHLFDASSTVQEDYEIGEAFMANYRPENSHYADAATRRAVVAGLRSRFPRPDKRQATPNKHLAEPAKMVIDMDFLMQSYDDGVSGKHSRKPAA